MSISADDVDEETGASGVELIDVLDDDLDDAAASDDEQNIQPKLFVVIIFLHIHGLAAK